MNEFIRDRLPDLYAGDELAQQEIYFQCFDPLLTCARRILHNREDAEEAVQDGFTGFFTRCRIPPLQDETHPWSYLRACVLRAANRYYVRELTYADRKKIAAITAAVAVTQVTIDGHGLDGKQPIKLSRTNSDPSVDGKYGGRDAPYGVLDDDTIEVPISVSRPGDKGYVHFRRKLPPAVSLQGGPDDDDDSGGFEPAAPGTKPQPDVRRLFEKCAHKLTERERTILEMYFDNCSYAEIGEAIGRSPENVRKTNLPNAVEALKKAILDSPGDDDDFLVSG